MNRLIAARPDDATARSYWTMSRSDSDRSFRAARRHSRRVRLVRVALPVIAAIIVSALMLWSWLNPARLLAKLPDNINDIVVSGTKITMEQPRMSGFTRDARGYELSAAAASQDIAKPDIVELRDIHAKLQMLDKSTAQLTARDGTYDTKKEMLRLGQDVVLSSSTGYKAWLTDALINVRASTVVTEKPVEVLLLQGTLHANRLEILEAGDLLRFDGGVRMKLQLDKIDAAAGGNGAPVTATAPSQPAPDKPRPR